MAKPVGPRCNLACTYCFYGEKDALFPAGESLRMPDAVLEAYVRGLAEAVPGPDVNYSFQGGEPTLAGLDFFRRAVELAKTCTAGRKVSYALQTNGLVLDDEWCGFLAEHRFLVGLSLDGPERVHDRHRVDRHGRGHFEETLQALERLRKHGVDVNTLTVISRANAGRASEVYRFLKALGVEHMQFIPLVERRADAGARRLGLDFAAPPDGETAGEPPPVMPWSVPPDDYGRFLSTIFDEWVRRDVGKVFVQTFEVALGAWLGLGSSLCVFAERCGRALILEHNGDVYACDHYVYPAWRRGSILETPLRDMVDGPPQTAFGEAKSAALPRMCRECPWLFACHGACPKHRFMRAPGGEWGRNYLCPGLRRFFSHVDPSMRRLAELLRNGYTAPDIMLEGARRESDPSDRPRPARE